jgi:uncharacterized protein (TIGR00369 family)
MGTASTRKGLAMTTTRGPARHRTVIGDDPVAAPGASQARSGIDYLRAIQRRELSAPPIAGLIQMEMCAVDHGRVVFSCVPDESMYNSTGTIHCGVARTLLDSVARCALLSRLPAGKSIASVEIKACCLKAVYPHDGQPTATGTVIKSGTRVGFTEGFTADARGAVVATASSTLVIVEARVR